MQSYVLNLPFKVFVDHYCNGYNRLYNAFMSEYYIKAFKAEGDCDPTLRQMLDYIFTLTTFRYVGEFGAASKNILIDGLKRGGVVVQEEKIEAIPLT